VARYHTVLAEITGALLALIGQLLFPQKGPRLRGRVIP